MTEYEQRVLDAVDDAIAAAVAMRDQINASIRRLESVKRDLTGEATEATTPEVMSAPATRLYEAIQYHHPDNLDLTWAMNRTNGAYTRNMMQAALSELVDLNLIKRVTPRAFDDTPLYTMTTGGLAVVR